MSKENGCAPEACCCCACGAENDLLAQYDKAKDRFVLGERETPEGRVPVAATALNARDRWGAFKVRWDVGRMQYRVAPGLYAVGSPGPEAPVLVSANYKLSFDALRRELAGLDAWILVLDTKGVNVWCAAGKGSFGTEELLRRIEACRLSGVVAHRRLVLPQLGAPGVNAAEVARRSGFTVHYGPVRAKDLPAYLAAGGKATPEMRAVSFGMAERAVLAPTELKHAAKPLLLVFGLLFLLNLVVARPFGLGDVLLIAGAVLAGTVGLPLLLPLLPGRAFSCKGWVLGLVETALLLWLLGWFSPANWMLAAGYLLVLPACTAYLGLNFTGSSTYTSFSGVQREMRLALPPMLCAGALGLVLILLKSFLG